MKMKPSPTDESIPHIMLVTGCFAAGGAERVLTILANEWASRGINITAVAIGDTGEAPFFQFSDRVAVGTLGLEGESSNALVGLARNIARIRILHKALRHSKPDVVISFLDQSNVLTLLATRGLGVPVIVSERTDPAGREIGRAWEILRKFTYPWADCLVCQGERPFRYFPERIRRRGVVIPNPVMVPAGFTGGGNLSHRLKSQRMIAALGSLRREKGFDLLIEAFGRIASKHPLWSLTIWGEGAGHSSLQTQANAIGIEGRVFLPGVTREPFARLTEADLFVLASRVEGFPNALCEAMAVGLPVIATDVGAVSDIVRHGIDGILIPTGNVPAMAVALDRLMGNHDERLRLASRAPEVLERFSLGKVIGTWEELISEVTGKFDFSNGRVASQS
jgi:GalNAc-alpha-(1->4)-GalNAc-alpha-(1->3)-diNAcBac-PP-undecaprenol alpha-1,4-N-acetyl-D-galactosaminyltransferase